MLAGSPTPSGVSVGKAAKRRGVSRDVPRHSVRGISDAAPGCLHCCALPNHEATSQSSRCSRAMIAREGLMAMLRIWRATRFSVPG